MSIRWDPLLVRHVARELESALSGAALQRLRLDARTRSLVLFFRDRTLLWRLHPDEGFPLLLAAVDPQDGDLRLRARVRSVLAPPDERLIRFELVGSRGGDGPWQLVVELMGNRMNALVLEGVVGTIRHVLRTSHGRRPLVVGRPYEAPSPTGREGVEGGLTRERWRELVEAVPPPQRSKHVLSHVAWTSPVNVDALLGEDGYALWRRIADPAAAAEPVLLTTPKGPQPYPLAIPGVDAEPIASLMEGFARCEAVRRGGEDSSGADHVAPEGDEPGVGVPAALVIGPELLERLEDAIAHEERRIVSLEAELQSRDDPDGMRHIGDLVLARFADIPRGASEVELADFDGATVNVRLDPELAPNENAAAYYDRAARSERAAERIPSLIHSTVAERDRLVGLQEAALAGRVDPEKLRAALPRDPARQRRGTTEAALPYRTFRSSGGLEIRVGRGARHNDDLTFRHSAPGDVWLHARHTAGAHVVLRWPHKGAPPARDLEEAAVLAALHSKARTSGSAPVDWTFRKYVRKPRGSAPGSVVADRTKTIFVAPDEALLETLADG